MRRKFDGEKFLSVCEDGEAIIQFCKEKGIASFAALVEAQESFPVDKKEIWFQRLCSAGFIKFLKSKGIH